MERQSNLNPVEGLKWDWTTDKIKSAQQEETKVFLKTLEDMIKQKGKRNKANTIDILAKFEYDFFILSSNIAFYKDNGN